MSADLRVENILIQVRSKLQDSGIKLWLQPYYDEGIGTIETELEVKQSNRQKKKYLIKFLSFYT